MTRDEFIKMLKANLKPSAELDFLVADSFEDGRPIWAFLKVDDVCMNADIDDLNNRNRGGIVFKIQDDLYGGK